MLLAAGGENPHESWVVALKEDGPLKARLVVQGFTDQRPTASRRHRQIFLTTVASLWFQIHKGDVKCSFHQGDLANNMWTTTTMTFSKLSQRNQFPTPVPELSRKLQLEHHQFVRLLNAVYDLVNAPRRWYHRVVIDLRNMGGEESLLEPCLWTFRDEMVSFRPLCFLYVDDFVLACSDSPFGKRVFDGINNLYEWKTWESTWESRVCTQCGARITQACDKHTKTYCEFEISFAESHSSTCHHIDDET